MKIVHQQMMFFAQFAPNMLSLFLHFANTILADQHIKKSLFVSFSLLHARRFSLNISGLHAESVKFVHKSRNQRDSFVLSLFSRHCTEGPDFSVEKLIAQYMTESAPFPNGESVKHFQARSFLCTVFGIAVEILFLDLSWTSTSVQITKFQKNSFAAQSDAGATSCCVAGN